ncbi:MAG: hypothetical protein JO345_34600 [Streptosporangiaceae bacterium]|nr:hypothetical protein [Streptosporangiaceae bacterium]
MLLAGLAGAAYATAVLLRLRVEETSGRAEPVLATAVGRVAGCAATSWSPWRARRCCWRWRVWRPVSVRGCGSDRPDRRPGG